MTYTRTMYDVDVGVDLLDRCIRRVSDFSGFHFFQCSRKRGYGPDGLFCKQHAKMIKPQAEPTSESGAFGEGPSHDPGPKTEPDFRKPTIHELEKLMEEGERPRILPSGEVVCGQPKTETKWWCSKCHTECFELNVTCRACGSKCHRLFDPKA